MTLKQHLQKIFGFQKFTTTECFITSHFVSPVGLLGYRVFVLFYAIFMFTYDMVITTNFANGQMYFTVLSYEFLIIHFLVWRHISLRLLLTLNCSFVLLWAFSWKVGNWQGVKMKIKKGKHVHTYGWSLTCI